MRSNGVDVYGLSVQNEPDWTAPYNSMLYTDREMVDFVRTLGPRLASLSPPEAHGWRVRQLGQHLEPRERH